MIKYGLAGLFVFLGGFAVMVLEIVGARLLAKDFGSSFYVWTSQIGVILVALSMGYFFGGILADKLKNFPVRVSRIARGIPIGSDLEFADMNTLSRAMEGRMKVQ